MCGESASNGEFRGFGKMDCHTESKRLFPARFQDLDRVGRIEALSKTDIGLGKAEGPLLSGLDVELFCDSLIKF